MMHNFGLFSIFALLPFILWIGVLVFGIWFSMKLLHIFEEKNELLKDIAQSLKNNQKDDL